jgi:hypothetical protein
VTTDKNQNNRGAVRHGDLYSVCPEVIKELVQISFRREPSFESSVQSQVIRHSAFVRVFSLQLWGVNQWKSKTFIV